jgi:hypothetical protein
VSWRVRLFVLLIVFLCAQVVMAAGDDGVKKKGRQHPVHEAASLSWPDAQVRIGSPLSSRPVPAGGLRQQEPGDKGWQVIFSDDLESDFPGTNWDITSVGADAHWLDWPCHSGDTPDESAGCAAGGGAAISCGGNYPDNMSTMMSYGPFSLADPGITDAELNFNFYYYTETDYDWFWVVARNSEAGEWWGYRWSGPEGTIAPYSFDLTNVPTLGNLLGQSQVWVAFVFTSDGSINNPDGAAVDDIVLQVFSEANTPPEVTVTAPNGGETWAAGSSQTITYTANDPDGAPSPLTIGIDYSTNGGAQWTEIASGLSNTGSHPWTLPSVSSSDCLVRVRASDGEDEVSDSSNATFAIIQNQSPQVTVLSPNGGEDWLTPDTQTITYTASDPDGSPSPLTIGIDYSTNGGAQWTEIVSGLSNTGSYDWALPLVTSSTCQVRVRASDGAEEVNDTSDANFTIHEGMNTLSIGDGSGSSGASVTVQLMLANENSVKGIQTDITYNAAVATFGSATATGRGAGMTAASEEVASGQARVLLYFDDASVLTPGSGAVGELTFNLVGNEDDTTDLVPTAIVISDPEAAEVSATGENGTLTVTAPSGPPLLYIAALKNPGRVRSLQILVRVEQGSGSAPTVTAGGAAVTLTSLGNSIYLGTYAAADGASNVTITATDSNGSGQGSDQVTVNF